MTKNKILYNLPLVALLAAWLYTYYVPNSYIRTRIWKEADGNSPLFRRVFGDLMGFQSPNNAQKWNAILREDGTIYQSDNLFYLGRIEKRYHNYQKTYIVIKDANDSVVTYTGGW